MAIHHLSVVSLPVADPERAKAFYAGALGFEVLEDSEFAPGQRWLQLAPPGAQTSVSLTTWFEEHHPLRGLILDVDDIDAERARLEAQDVRFTEETFETPWGRFAGFEDLDGNRWSLHGP